jgi:CHASE1-domain containing sensor protein
MELAARRKQRGSVLLDLLLALLIASTALLLSLGGIALAARTSQTSERRILELIAKRSEDARSRTEIFTAESH